MFGRTPRAPASWDAGSARVFPVVLRTEGSRSARDLFACAVERLEQRAHAARGERPLVAPQQIGDGSAARSILRRDGGEQSRPLVRESEQGLIEPGELVADR